MRRNLKVGVALSAGGAAAMAQIGVLEVLTAAGIPIRYVAGTSAGAMVGAAFAAQQLDAFRDMMSRLTRRRVIWTFDPTWPRSGLLAGHNAMRLIRPYVGDRIETLAIHYAAVATDLATGAEVILDEGDVVDAIRASIAIPGIFTPRRAGDRLLVDGGLVNPVPVSATRALGADFVIAVSVLTPELARRMDVPDAVDGKRVTTQLLARLLARLRRQAPAAGTTETLDPDSAGVVAEAQGLEEERGLIEVLLQATRVVESHLAACRLREVPPQVLIKVPVRNVGIFDFHRSRDAVEAGRTAAEKALPRIRAALGATVPLHRRMRRWLGESTVPSAASD